MAAKKFAIRIVNVSIATLLLLISGDVCFAAEDGARLVQISEIGNGEFRVVISLGKHADLWFKDALAPGLSIGEYEIKDNRVSAGSNEVIGIVAGPINSGSSIKMRKLGDGSGKVISEKLTAEDILKAKEIGLIWRFESLAQAKDMGFVRLDEGVKSGNWASYNDSLEYFRKVESGVVKTLEPISPKMDFPSGREADLLCRRIESAIVIAGIYRIKSSVPCILQTYLGLPEGVPSDTAKEIRGLCVSALKQIGEPAVDEVYSQIGNGLLSVDDGCNVLVQIEERTKLLADVKFRIQQEEGIERRETLGKVEEELGKKE